VKVELTFDGNGMSVSHQASVIGDR
jgi:hypothetical protein